MLLAPHTTQRVWFPGSAWEPTWSGLCPGVFRGARKATRKGSFASRYFVEPV